MATNLFWVYDALQPLERMKPLYNSLQGISSVSDGFYFLMSDRKIYSFQKKIKEKKIALRWD